MSLQVVPTASRPRVSEEDRAFLRHFAGPVGRAARHMIEQGHTTFPLEDLEGFGMLAIWAKLQAFDPERATLERWAFYVAFNAMRDASRAAVGEALFEKALRRGALGRVALDDQPAQADFHNDTPETDLARLRARTRRKAASAWLQARLDTPGADAPIEQARLAGEALQALHEEMDRLSSEQRELVRLRFWDDEEVKDAAVRLGTSERTLRRRWIDLRDLLEARLRARGVLGVPEGFEDAADALALASEEQR